MYDFDTVVDRRNTGSLKWDVAKNELPMWVADMDFKTAPQIIDAISERVSHGVFGYSIIRMSGMMRIFRGGTDAMGLKSKETT